MTLPHKKYVALWALSLCIVTLNSANAELTVISDYGGRSMDAFYDVLDPQDEVGKAQQKSLAPEKIKIDEGLYLPVHSERLNPARFNAYEIDYPTLQPFIIIGYDDLSIEWLNARHDDLVTIDGLVGVVVNIDDTDELNTLKALTDIPLYAVKGDELAEKFDITHYPALITHRAVEQ
ncbi:integrating conjugative element protein [Orbus sturtevantii]|uniref:PFL_4695 family integrating conjugative element protein n=1 Tax=Orbus sturtevantii TaxID=3074109 RepID=UPI00370D240E